MYDQMRGGPPPSAPGPVPVPAPSGLVTGTALKLPKDETTPQVTRLETIEDIKKAWYAEYRPEGYDTTVEGRVEKGLLIIKIERAHSSD